IQFRVSLQFPPDLRGLRQRRGPCGRASPRKDRRRHTARKYRFSLAKKRDIRLLSSRRMLVTLRRCRSGRDLWSQRVTLEKACYALRTPHKSLGLNPPAPSTYIRKNP